MEALECIKTRRSVRRYTDEPVAIEELEAIIAAASMAPSWKNCQSVRYTAVCDPELKERVAADCVMGFTPNQAIIRSCKVLIVLSYIYGRSGFERDGSYITSKGDRWQMFDAGVAAQTFCLAAHDLGLGTVILGIMDEELLSRTVSLPEGQVPAALIALGHASDIPKAPKRKTVEDLLTVKA